MKDIEKFEKEALTDEELELVNGGVGNSAVQERSDGVCGVPHQIEIYGRLELCKDFRYCNRQPRCKYNKGVR